MKGMFMDPQNAENSIKLQDLICRGPGDIRRVFEGLGFRITLETSQCLEQISATMFVCQAIGGEEGMKSLRELYYYQVRQDDPEEKMRKFLQKIFFEVSEQSDKYRPSIDVVFEDEPEVQFFVTLVLFFEGEDDLEQEQDFEEFDTE